MTESTIINSIYRTTTPGVEHSNNFKEYFLKHDGLENLTRELGFTIFNKYMCKAGCKMCYLRDTWIPDEEFGAYVPKELTPETEERILQFFDWFETISVIDDLYYIKNNYPHLYGFYQRNSKRLTSSQMSDTAFIQQYKIMMEELHFKNVYEISFSDTFLGKKGGKMVDDIVVKLSALHARSPIIKLKVIIQEVDGHKSPQVTRFIAFANELGLHVGVHNDFTQGNNIRLDFDESQDAQQELNQYAEDSEPKTVLCEVLYLAYTSVVLTINDATEARGQIAYDIMTNGIKDVDHFIADMMQSKLEVYARYAKEITDKTSKHQQYFDYASKNIYVDRGFNFLPRMFLQPWTRIYIALRNQGWTDTPYGLYDTTCTDGVIRPLIKFQPVKQPFEIKVVTTI